VEHTGGDLRAHSEDIARSGATSIPDVLRLVPGVEVARIESSRNWVVGIRGFGDQYSKSVLLLIDGRSAYTPLWAGVHWPSRTRCSQTSSASR
jgi:iron complex outermembrane receptor protein